MCPDREILSAYFDGELDTFWKFKVENHLRECAVCRDQVLLYKKIRSQLPRVNPGFISSCQETVWRKLEEATAHMVIHQGPMQRKVVIPLPVLAAAVVLLFFFAGLSFYQQRINHELLISIQETPESLSMELSYQTLQQLKTLAEILSGETPSANATEVFLTIPSQPVFQTNGAPQVIRAIDFAGRQ